MRLLLLLLLVLDRRVRPEKELPFFFSAKNERVFEEPYLAPKRSSRVVSLAL
jgi:hypothetical protein